MSSQLAEIEALFLERKVMSPLSDELSAVVSAEDLLAIADQLESQYGDFQGISGGPNAYIVQMQRGLLKILYIKENGLLSGFRIVNFEPYDASLQQALKSLRQLSGEVAFELWTPGGVIGQWHSEKELSVGSSFKLCVLAALEDLISSDANEFAWKSILQLDSESKSYPTGIMHTWPEGTHVTIETAAILMASISDNTAADLLMRNIDPKILSRAFKSSRPLLTTKQFFQRSTLANEAPNSKVLPRRHDRNDKSDPPTPRTVPYGNGVGWYLSPQALRSCMLTIDRKELLKLAAAPFPTDQFKNWGFKGGESEGVMSIVIWAVTPTDQFIFSLIQNDSEGIDKILFLSAVSDVMAAISREGNK